MPPSIATANPYLALGVRPFINCCSVRTMHGGSLMLPQVRTAIDAASRQFVNLDELMNAAGKRIAELTGAEWGVVTCGSAAAVALGTAACVAGNDPVRMLRLPFTDGMVNRVIIPRKQRFAYDQAVRMIGCHIVAIDTRDELDRPLEGPADEGVEGGHHRRHRGARILVRGTRHRSRAPEMVRRLCDDRRAPGPDRRRARRGDRARGRRPGAAAQDRLGPRPLSARRRRL